MADYRYMNGGYKTDESPRYNKWDTSSNQYETQSPRWGKHGTGSGREGHHDHVCKPVIIDAQGRKRPIVSYGPMSGHQTNGIVTKTETVIEQAHIPPISYGNSSPTKSGNTKEYGASRGGWNFHDRSPKVDDFFSKVQLEASRPEKTSLMSGLHWRHKDNSDGYNGSNSHGLNYNYGSHGSNRHSGKTKHDPYFHGHQGHHQIEREREGSPGYQQMERERDGRYEPVVNTSGGWVRPSPLGWALPPSNDTPLSNPTNDIGTVIDYMKDAAKHTPANMIPVKPWPTVPTPTVPTINSSEARRRYGNFSESPLSVQTANSYSSAIDSREAVRKYGGQLM